MDTSLKEILQVAKFFSNNLFEFFVSKVTLYNALSDACLWIQFIRLIVFVVQVKVEDWDDRGIKGLKIESTNFTTFVNSTVSKTFELYVLYDDLSVNPIAGNADVLRQQARNDGNSLCSITFPVPYGPGWNESVVNGVKAIDDNSSCSITVCLTGECTAPDNNKTLEYHNCTRACDIVIEDKDNKFSLYTVPYANANATPNNITLIGIFEKPSNDGVLGGPSEYFGIPINSPVHPSIVPRFKTLQDLADRMGKVLTAVTTIDTTVTIQYSEGAAGEPGSLLFGIAFEGNVQTPPGGISFDSTLQLGDLASVKVQDASFEFLGQISVSNEFGIVFSPDESESLKLVGVRQNENETSCNTTAFNATIIYEKDNTKGNETITITPACDIDGKLGSMVQAFSGNARLNSDVSVSSIGSSGTFAVAFDPLYSYVQILVDIGDNSSLNRFGIANGEFEKKAAFQFASGLFDLTAGFELNGGAEITANIADVLEATAVVDASFFGQVQFSAGKQGQLIPFDDWLAKLVDIMNDTSTEDYDPDFAVAVLTFDGTITGKVTVDALGVSAGVAGYFLEPYNYYLLPSGNNTGPKFEMDVNLPSFGDLRNLSVGDVINLLQQALELLVGSEEADTVESCSGGLLGVDIFTTKIPVVAVSACDFAGVLKIVVDAVDTLVNECSGCADSSGTSSSDDLTFQALETKLTNLLQGRQ